MEITDVRIRKIPEVGAGRMLAVASITFDNVFVVHDIKIIKAAEKTFVAMPSRKNGNTFIDIVHPISQEFRDYITETVLKAYDDKLKTLN